MKRPRTTASNVKANVKLVGSPESALHAGAARKLARPHVPMITPRRVDAGFLSMAAKLYVLNDHHERVAEAADRTDND